MTDRDEAGHERTQSDRERCTLHEKKFPKLATLLLMLTLGLAPWAASVAQIPAKAGAVAAAASTPGAQPIDLNSATPDQLKSIPGIGDAYAKRIVDGRPYTAKNQLVTKGVLPQGVYDKVKDRIVARRAKP